MVDKKLRKRIQAFGEDQEVEIKILDNHAYDKSIVGVTLDGRLVYDYNKMLEEYQKDEHCSYEDAAEWIHFNTLRSIPYMGEDGPIIITETPETLAEKY
ncbi:MAG: hypothetical protein MJZ20_06830 [Bacteroidaceae bacterium]|nr:hypothetical protein [Bacteroidaceae bacterium]